MQFRKQSQSRKFARRAAVLLEGLESRILMTTNSPPFYGVSTISSLTGGIGAGTRPTNLIADSAGDLFGTTEGGGLQNYGTVFEIPVGTSKVLTLASFSKTINLNNIQTGTQTSNLTPGFTPEGALVLDSNGNLFGTTANGGLYNRGTIWELAAGSNQIVTLWSFSGGSGGGAYPITGLVSDGSGNLWGTTYGNNTNLANIFEFSLSNTTNPYRSIATFSENTHVDAPLAVNAANVTTTAGDLISNNLTLAMDSNGNVFGAASTGGNGAGFIFVCDTTTGTISQITSSNLSMSSFDSNNNGGIQPIGTMFYVQGLGSVTNSNGTTTADGTLIGITSGGGAKGAGTIYEAVLSNLTTSSPTANIGILQSFQAFNQSNSSNQTTSGSNGARPLGDLLLSTATLANGTWTATMFGVTAQGSGNGNGEIYSANLSLTGNVTNGTFADKNTVTITQLPSSSTANLTLTNSTGINPTGGLVVSTLSNGTIGTAYVTTASQGAFQDGTILQATQLTSNTTLPHFVFSKQPAGTTAGKTIGAITIKTVDANGKPVNFNGNVTLSIFTGPNGSAITGNGSLTATAVNGVATFPSGLIINQAGTYTLLAMDTSDAAVASTQSGRFAINTASAAQLVVVAQQSTGSAGLSIGTIVINVEDSFGNVITGNGSKVTLSIPTGQGPAGGKITNGTANAKTGVAIFGNVTLSTPGAYTLQAKDGSLPVVNLSTITIGPAPAQLAFTQVPATGVVGKSFVVEVTVEDAMGNPLPNDTSAVKISLASGSGLFGTLTVQAVAGVATFADLVSFTAQKLRFQAVDGNLTALSSNLTLTLS